MKSYKIHLIRHGLTEGNIKGLYIGKKTDCPVCEEGIAELKRLKETYDYPDIEKLYSSPLLRCTQTANILYEDYTPHIIENLAECDFGEFEGKSPNEIPEKDMQRFIAWLKGTNCNDVDAENPLDFIKRCMKGYIEIVNDMVKNDISSAALVSHGGVIMSLLSAMGIPQKPATEWIINNGMGYTTIVTPTLWMRDNIFEIFDIIPRIKQDDPDYDIYYNHNLLEKFIPNEEEFE